METELDRELAKAQAALLARFAPDTRVRRIRWSGGETQLFELGTGAPLLYVHGGLSGAYEIVPILGALAENHRVLAVDRPGHGLADPFDYRDVDLLDHARTFLREILDALELSTVDVVANSMGALWSVAFAIDAPSRVSRLALVGAPAGLKRQVPLQLLLLGLPLIGQRLGRHVFSNATRDGSRKFWGQVLVEHPEQLDDLLLDFDVANARRNVDSMLGLVECIADFRRLGLRSEVILGKRWQSLTTPTLLVWGEHDAFGSPDEGEALVAANPNLRLVRVAGAGHLPWLDDPERVVPEIERFLATEPRSGVAAVA
ncbi:MAG: alpha/beta hydrolase [Actinomycetota bacterium]|nr:alpha/beta hydrolase [Actinomycetota bacterium]